MVRNILLCALVLISWSLCTLIKKHHHDYTSNWSSLYPTAATNCNRQAQLQSAIDNDDFSSLVTSILDSVRLTREEIEETNELYADVEQALNTAWPGCSIEPYGSLVTGMGMKSSDADMELHYKSKLTTLDFLSTTEEVFSKFPEKFSSFVANPEGRVPFVSLIYIPQKREVNISYSGIFGVISSKVLKFLLNTDKRVLTLALLVKYWLKVHDLSGPDKMKSYTSTLLVIFYLQQLHVLPTVQWFQQQTNQSEHLVNNWDTGFPNNLTQVTTQSIITMRELLGGFFKYYSEYDFEKYVISPFTGLSIQRSAFRNLSDVPNSLKRYKLNVANGLSTALAIETPLCVQNIINHDDNSAARCTKLNYLRLRSKLKQAAKLYEESSMYSNKTLLEKLLLL